MKIQKSKKTEKKKVIKAGKVKGISKVAKKAEVDSRKMKTKNFEFAEKKQLRPEKNQNVKNNFKKTERILSKGFCKMS